MDSSNLKIINARIITPTGILNNGSLLVRDGKITAITEGEMEGVSENVIDACGKYLSPGFIDIHVHGGGGHDFMDNTIAAYLEIAKLHASHGTTSFTPTTLSCEKDALLKTLSLYEESEP
jgi:N-acetylglucosamine-6-phosphate deacetylase